MTREVGSKIPISVGTAIPFEERVVTDGPVPDTIWMNVRTLIRNYWASYSNDNRPSVNSMFKDFLEEMDMIAGSCMSQQIEPRFYIPDYSAMNRIIPTAIVKEDTTDNQKAYRTAEKALIDVVRAKYKDDTSNRVIECRTRIPGDGSNAWIMTSFPLDLLSRYEWSSLTLLESHTGKLSDHMQWHLKLSKNPDHSRLPFNILTMIVIGDRSNLFRSYSIKYKRVLVELAKERSWTQLTTTTKIMSDLKHIEDDVMRELFVNACRTILV